METGQTKRPMVCSGVKNFIRFFMCGPSTNGGWFLWGLLWPLTFPIWMVSQFIIGCIEVMVGAMTGNIVVVDGGGSGEGLFDEVSCRRREDIQFLTGTGKYAKENW